MAMNFFKKKQKTEEDTDFIEIDSGMKKSDSKVLVKTFTIRMYDDVNLVLNALREGYSIVIIDTRPIKTKDVIELKRVVSKIKKTVEAIEGSIAGFGENIIIATPSFAKVQKGTAEEDSSSTRSEIEKF